jgi:hypothetical protein
MKRWIGVSLTASLLGIASAHARAQEISAPNYEGRLLRRHEHQSRQARADELRVERAQRRARERMSREEMYERLGYSPLRPYIAQSPEIFGTPSYTVWRPGYVYRPYRW